MLSMNVLLRRYTRLREELSTAYGRQPWSAERIDRLAERLVATERAIAALQTAVDRGGPHRRLADGEPGRG